MRSIWNPLACWGCVLMLASHARAWLASSAYCVGWIFCGCNLTCIHCIACYFITRQGFSTLILIPSCTYLAGMDPEKSFQAHPETGKAELAPGTGGIYSGGLRPGD